MNKQAGCSWSGGKDSCFALMQAVQQGYTPILLVNMMNENGQILVDSSDIIYMFDDDEDGGKWVPSDNEYYGELVFNIEYKGEKEIPFDWMYVDYNTLQNAAVANGLQCELVLEGEHYDYLARLFV